MPLGVVSFRNRSKPQTFNRECLVQDVKVVRLATNRSESKRRLRVNVFWLWSFRAFRLREVGFGQAARSPEHPSLNHSTGS